MKTSKKHLLFLLLAVIPFWGISQCSVSINPQGATTFCAGDSVVLIASGSGGSSTPTLDQSQLIYNAGTSARTLPGYSHWQSFTAGITGTLCEIDMGFFTYINGVGTLDIYAGEGTAGALLQTQQISVVCSGGNCMLPYYVSAPVVDGQMYTFHFTPGAGMPDPYGVQMEVPGTYPGGQFAIVDPSGTSYPGFDMVFKTYVCSGGAVSYTWSNSANDSDITVHASCDYSVTISDQSGCSASDVIHIYVSPKPDTAGIITGPVSICAVENAVIYSVPSITNATSYNWTLPNGANGSSASNIITVDFDSSAVSGNITVKGVDNCGYGIESDLYVTVNQTPAAPIISDAGNTIVSNYATGNQWYNASELLPGDTNQVFTPTVSGYFYDIVTINGCVSDTSNKMDFLVSGIPVSDPTNEHFDIYPNPSNGMITAKFYCHPSESLTITLNNALGEIVCTDIIGTMSGWINRIYDFPGLNAGVYYMMAKTEKQLIVKKVIIN